MNDKETGEPIDQEIEPLYKKALAATKDSGSSEAEYSLELDEIGQALPLKSLAMTKNGRFGKSSIICGAYGIESL